MARSLHLGLGIPPGLVGDHIEVGVGLAVWLQNVVGMWCVGRTKPTRGGSRVCAAVLAGGLVDARQLSPGPHNPGCPR